MIQRRELYKGDVIFNSNPFVHILIKDKRRTHCSNCLRMIEELHGCRSSVLCPDCERMSYCSEECLLEDRSDHRLECHIMEELSLLPDISRIMARLLLKLEEGGDDQSESLPFSQGERRFQELESHADRIEEDDQWARQIFDSLSGLIPSATGSWQRFKQVYGRLIINSFEISGEEDDDDKLGWALYLAPSILDHSCVPSAEVHFQGKTIIIKSKVNMVDINLRKIYISYIDLGEATEVRRGKLKKHYHFDCLCDRCTGIKLSWMISEPLNEKLKDILLQENCVATAVRDQARGQDREYLGSMRCQKCSGRPVHVSQDRAVCRHCKESSDSASISEYFEIKAAVEKVLKMDQIPADAAPQCLELMTGLFHPYDLTYISTCSLAMTDSIMQNRLGQAVEFGNILLGVVRRFARGSLAQLELLKRLMRLEAELGNRVELDKLVQGGLVDIYSNTELCTDILLLRDRLYKEYFSSDII